MKEVARLLDLVPYLSTHSHISIKELSKEFGVSEREMTNELTALSMCGLPGYTPYELIEVFFDSGYVTIRNHDTLDLPRSLTAIEIATLLMGLHILRDRVEDERGDLLEKIDLLSDQMRNLLGNQITLEEIPENQLFPLIEKAIVERKGLHLRYASTTDDGISERIIRPINLYHESDIAYLVAFCRRAEAVRHFRVDRILDLSLIDIETEYTLPNEGRANQEIAEKSTFLNLKVHSAHRSVAELFSLGTQERRSISEGAGETVIGVFSEEWAIRAIIASARAVEILGEDGIRHKIRQRAENILALYSS